MSKARSFGLLAIAGIAGVAMWTLHRAFRIGEEERERMRLAQKTARMWSWDYDVASRRVSWTLPKGDDIVVRETTYDEVVANIHPDDRALVIAAIERALATDGDYALEHRIVSPTDGRVHWLAARGEVVSRDPGRLIGVTVDVCEHRKARELERIAAQAKLAAELAHQINNPLEIINGNLHLLGSSGDFSETAAANIHRAQEAVRRIRDSVQDIVDLLVKSD